MEKQRLELDNANDDYQTLQNIATEQGLPEISNTDTPNTAQVRTLETLGVFEENFTNVQTHERQLEATLDEFNSEVPEIFQQQTAWTDILEQQEQWKDSRVVVEQERKELEDILNEYAELEMTSELTASERAEKKADIDTRANAQVEKLSSSMLDTAGQGVKLGQKMGQLGESMAEIYPDDDALSAIGDEAKRYADLSHEAQLQARESVKVS